jgi:hypothetical protein
MLCLAFSKVIESTFNPESHFTIIQNEILVLLQKGPRVVMLERSEASGGGVFIDSEVLKVLS